MGIPVLVYNFIKMEVTILIKAFRIFSCYNIILYIVVDDRLSVNFKLKRITCHGRYLILVNSRTKVYLSVRTAVVFGILSEDDADFLGRLIVCSFSQNFPACSRNIKARVCGL